MANPVGRIDQGALRQALLRSFGAERAILERCDSNQRGTVSNALLVARAADLAELDTGDLLRRVVCIEQLLVVEDMLLEEAGTRRFDLSVAQMLGAAEVVFNPYPLPPKPLEIDTALHISHVSIPSVAEESVRISYSLYAGAYVRDIVSARDLLTEAEQKALRIDDADGVEAAVESATDAVLKVVRKLLELRLECLGGEDSPPKEEVYFGGVGDRRRIWRTVEGQAVLGARFAYREFPLDEVVLPLEVRHAIYWTPNQVVLINDRTAGADASLKVIGAEPSSFKLRPKQAALVSEACLESAEVSFYSHCRAELRLARVRHGMLVRTVIPTGVMVLVPVGAYAFSVWMLKGEARAVFLDTLQLQAIPTLLVACVALQWSSVQQIPVVASRTQMDSFFLCAYAVVVGLFFLCFFRSEVVLLGGSIVMPALVLLCVLLVWSRVEAPRAA